MKILLGIDGSRYALAAVRFASEYLAQRGRRAEVLHVLPLVVQPGAAPPRRQPERVRLPAASRSWLERAEKRLQARGFRTARRVRRGTPARVVTELGAEGDYDLVVIGAKGRSDVPFLGAGSVALAALERVPGNVLVVRAPELEPEKEVATALRPFPVLFATDGSPSSARAARAFFRLFDVPELRPIAMAVAEMPAPAALGGMEAEQRAELLRQIENAAGVWAQQLKPLLARPGVRAQARAVRGRPAAAIIAAAKRSGARMIVLGSRGSSGPWGPRLGSVALQVARSAPCSVLIVR
jgi:nucleotide-binding universal stress UspA family protein